MPETFTRTVTLATGLALAEFIKAFLEDEEKTVKLVKLELQKSNTEAKLTFEES